MSDRKCDVVFDRVAQGISPVCRSLSFGARFQVSVKLNMELLWLVSSSDAEIPEDLKSYTNCCWANVVMQVVRRIGRRLSIGDTNELISMVRFANSRTQSVTDNMKSIIARLDLPVTFVEYYTQQSVGTVIGNINGPAVCCVLNSSHYTLWLPNGSTLTELFRSFDKIVQASHTSKPPTYRKSFSIRDKQMLKDFALALSLGDDDDERQAEYERDEVRKLSQIRSDEAYARSL
jgi:hypothetical protein